MAAERFGSPTPSEPTPVPASDEDSARDELEMEMRRLSEELRQDLVGLPSSYREGRVVVAAIGSTFVLQNEAGDVLATLRDERLARYLREVPSRLTALLEHIGFLEREAMEQRSVAHSDDIIRDELHAASEAGLDSPEGKRRVREAVEEAEHPSSSEKWRS